MNYEKFNPWKLKKDLEKTGFGVELKIRDLFSRIVFEDGAPVFRVESGGSYHDLDSGKSREYDLRVYRELFLSGLDWSPLTHFLFCEIKKTKHPWIVFKDNAYRYIHANAWSFSHAEHDVRDVMRHLGPTLRKSVGWTGSGVHEAFKSPDQPSKWYGAFLTALKAASEEYRADANRDEVVEGELFALTIYQPVVILDGVLLSVEYKKGEAHFEQIPYVSMSFDYKSSAYEEENRSIDIVTVDALGDYVRSIDGYMDQAAEIMYEVIEKRFKKRIVDKGLHRFQLDIVSPELDSTDSSNG